MKKIPKKNEIIVYTDGSSLGNPGNGGWGVIFLTDKKAFEMAGFQADVTNNQMELEAVYRALELMTERSIVGYEVNIYSDSKYVINGLTE
jgi:ribonuclease HI